MMAKKKKRERNEATRVREAEPDDFELTELQIRQLDRRTRDLRDPTRYMIQEPLLGMFYDATNDLWAWSDPEGGTAFKRRNMALAIMAVLKARDKGGFRVLKVKKLKNRRIQLPKGARQWSLVGRTRRRGKRKRSR